MLNYSDLKLLVHFNLDIMQVRTQEIVCCVEPHRNKSIVQVLSMNFISRFLLFVTASERQGKLCKCVCV